MNINASLESRAHWYIPQMANKKKNRITLSYKLWMNCWKLYSTLHYFGTEAFPQQLVLSECHAVWLSHFSIRAQFYLSGTTRTVKSDMWVVRCITFFSHDVCRRFFFPYIFGQCTCAQLKTKTIYFIISLQQIKTWCKKEIMKNMILKLITVIWDCVFVWMCIHSNDVRLGYVVIKNLCSISVSMCI